MSETAGIGSANSSSTRPSAPDSTWRSGSSVSRRRPRAASPSRRSSGQSPPPSVVPRSAMFECSCVHAAGGGASRARRQPVDRQSDRAVEHRVAVRLRLVERAVPDRDRHPPVLVPRRPRLDERAARRRPTAELAARRAEQLEHPRSPRTAACAGCRSSAGRTRRGTAAAPRRARRSGPRRPSRRAPRAGRPPSASRGTTSGAPQALSLIGAPWVGLTPHSVHQQRDVGTPEPRGDRPQVERRRAVRVGRDEVERDAGIGRVLRACRRPIRPPRSPGRRRAAIASTDLDGPDDAS